MGHLSLKRRFLTGLAATGSVALLASLSGCNEKAFLDPTIEGHWQRTPIALPILDRIAAIEDETGDLVEYSDPLPGDLVPQPMTYRLGQGDALRVTVWDIVETGRAEEHDVEIDARGIIEIPQLGRLQVGGLTTAEATEVVKAAMKRLVSDPLASVQALAQRQSTYTLIGAVERPGPYLIPRANYRLLEAMTAGGRFDEGSVEWVYVVREVSLADEAEGSIPLPATGTQNPPIRPVDPPQDLLNIIDELAPPPSAQPPAQPPLTPPQPGMMAPRRQPADKPRPPVLSLPDEQPSTVVAPADAPAPSGPTRWVFLNGKWTQVAAMQNRPVADAPGLPEATDTMVAQRVIRVPMDELLAGKQSVNIVIRPGDVIRIPSPPSGTIYIGGQVNNGGTFGLPPTGGLTLKRLLQAAGGYSQLAIPDRIDLTRVVGRDRQATIMLDGKAIARNTQPDIYLKPNDSINVGSNFWALPLAVVRNGFRASYGFGFVLDRNISNDLLGPPPVNQFGQ